MGINYKAHILIGTQGHEICTSNQSLMGIRTKLIISGKQWVFLIVALFA